MATMRALALTVGCGLCTVPVHADLFDFEPRAVDPAMVAFLDGSTAGGLRKADDRELVPYVTGASDFNGTTIMAAGVGVDWFVADGLSVGLFGEGMHVNQRGDNGLGGGGGVMLRWHLVEDEKFTLFLEAGVGYLLFSDPVPADGVTGDFTPRAAFGANIDLDARTSLSLHLGWLHLSNAQTGEDNPGIDAAAIGLGLQIEF